MLKPVLASFSIDDDLLKDLVRFFFLFGNQKLRMSRDYVLKSAGDMMDDQNKSMIGSKIILRQPFDLFYKYIINFLDDFDSIPKAVSTHIEFRYSRKVVWDFFSFLLEQNDNPAIKKTIIANHLKNNEEYFDNGPFTSFVLETIKEATEAEHPLNVSMMENVFFLISKIVSLYKFITVNNTIVNTITKVVSNNEVSFDTQAITDIQGTIQDMGTTALAASINEIVLGPGHNELTKEQLNFPIIPVRAFNEFKFFQERRVFMFVGSSGIGKSMILCHIAAEMWLNTAYKKAPNEAVFYFTMENPEQEINARILANAFYSHCGIPKTIDDMMDYNFTSSEFNQLRQKWEDVGRLLDIVFVQPKVYGCSMLRNLVRKRIFESGCVPYAIIVDFIDKLRSDKKKIDSEHQELGEIVDELRGLASEFQVPVVTVTHLNKDGCQQVKQDIKGLGGGNVGKSLRKFENADCVVFVDEEVTGLDYSVMQFYLSKHRYAGKKANSMHSLKYLGQHSYFGLMNEELPSGIQQTNLLPEKPIMERSTPFDDEDTGL